MKRRPSSQRWLHEHERDHYVKAARSQGYRSRSAFKLIEIQKRFKILKPGMTVVDLGAAPGSWTEIAMKFLGDSGENIIALDRNSMAPVKKATILQGDFLEESILNRLNHWLPQEGADLVMSDMAPDMTGIRLVDQAHEERLAEAVLLFAEARLSLNGALILKMFQRSDRIVFTNHARKLFTCVKQFKPKSSRPRSPEIYLVATGFSG